MHNYSESLSASGPAKRKYTKRQRAEVDEHVEVAAVKAPPQCWGPGCVHVARDNSRYCSDECGLAQARLLITHVLPNRIEQWRRMPCVTDDAAHARLKVLKEEQQKCNKRLSELHAQAVRAQGFASC